MSVGIFGGFKAGKQDDDDSFGAATKRLAGEYLNAVTAHSDDRVLVGHNLPDHYGHGVILRGRDDQSLLLLKGYIQHDSLLCTSPGFLHSFENSLRENACSTLEKCFGNYIGLYVNLQHNEVFAFADAFGTFALHYVELEGMLILGSSLISVALAAKAEVDRDAVNELLSFDQVLHGRTIFKNVRRLKPGELLRLSAGKITITRWASYAYELSEDPEDALLERYASDLQTSVRVASSFTRISCGLTGGFDTRAIWACLRSQQQKPVAYTHGVRDSADLDIASDVAGRMGLDHLVHQLDLIGAQELLDRFAEVVISSEGALGIEAALYQLGWELQARKGFRISIDGHGGPLHRRQILRVRAGFASRRRLRQMIAVNYSSSLSRSDCLRVQSQSDLIAELDETSQGEDLIDQFYLKELYGNRLSLAGNYQLRTIGVAHPLLSNRSYRVLRSLSAKLRRDKVPYRYLLERFAPELRVIPLEDHGFLVRYPGTTWKRLIKLALGRVQDRLGIALIRPRPYFDLPAIKRASISHFRRLVSEGSLLSDLIDQDRIIASSNAEVLHDAAKWSIYFGYLRSKGFQI